MIVLVLQYWQQDRAQADAVIRFITDLEPTKREDVRLRLVARADCPHLDMETIQYAAQKFDVSWVHAKTRTEGWPAGPNAMAVEILTTAPKWLHEAGWDDCFGILMLEPDVTPLHPFWLDKLIGAWVIALLDGCWQMGSWRESGGQWGHVNGCSLLHPKFAALTGLKTCPPDFAWDCYASTMAHDHWCKSGLFLNRFRGHNATEEILRTPERGGVPPVLVHGYKDDSALNIARKWCLQSVSV